VRAGVDYSRVGETSQIPLCGLRARGMKVPSSVPLLLLWLRGGWFFFFEDGGGGSDAVAFIETQ
jgi:hypothetical protein